MAKSRDYFGKERLPTPPPGKWHSSKKRADIDSKQAIEESLDGEQPESDAETEETEESKDR